MVARASQNYNPEGHIPFDYERCAALHNRIVELGRAGSVPRPHDTETWWDRFGWMAEMMELPTYLSPSVTGFLKRAITTTFRDNYQEDFFYELGGLSSPMNIFFQFDDVFHTDAMQDQFPRYILLYHQDHLPHGTGLLLDQKTSKAIMQTIFDDETITHFEGVEWIPLEEILSTYVEMIEEGKVFATEETTTVNGVLMRGYWCQRPYTDAEVNRTLDAWDRLLTAIESKVEDRSGLDHAVESFHFTEDVGLLDEQTLDLARIEGKFHRTILTRARRPRLSTISYIAPGIRIPSSKEEFISLQPFKDVDRPHDKEDTSNRPSLLFPGDGLARADGGRWGWQKPWNEPTDINCGLWIRDASNFPEHAQFLLPYAIGSNGFASGADKFRISKVGGWPRECELYSLGYNKFIEAWGTRLFLILENWAEMVERGDWQVDEHGVAGGIEKFKDADTEEHWEKYNVRVTW